jgi:general L-amino acid transport system substrate-binding protein
MVILAKGSPGCRPTRSLQIKKATVMLVLAGVLILAAAAARADTLGQIRKRGFLTCGSNTWLAGFGVPDGNGRWAGLDHH